MQRKHTTTACQICRENKTKCDGAKPICGSCKRKGRLCEYSAKDDKRKLSLRTAVEILYRRVEQLTVLANEHNLVVPPMGEDERSLLEQVCVTLELSPDGIVLANQYQQDALPSHMPASPPLTGPLQNVSTYDPSLSMDMTQNANPTNLPWDTGQSSDFDLQNWTEFFATESWDGSPSDWPWQVLNDLPGVSSYPAVQPQGLALAGNDIQVDNRRSESTSEDEIETDIIPRLAARFGSLRVATDGQLRYYGSASNYHFLTGVYHSEIRTDVRDLEQAAQTALENAKLDGEAPLSLQNHLIELFFAWHNPLHSTIDRSMFDAARALDSPNHRAYCSESLVNAICAIGAAFEGRYHQSFITFPKPLPEYFAERSKIFLEFEFDSPCVATVQALLLLSSHEAASGKDGRMWLYSGMAMRLSYDVGLHVDSGPYVKQGLLTSGEADVRRGTFWSCVVVNHLWSFSLGRPFRVDGEETTVPRPFDLPHMSSGTPWFNYPMEATTSLRSSNAGPGADLNALISEQWVSLCEELAPLVRVLYGCVKISKATLQSLSYKTTKRLQTWLETIPEAIKIRNDETPLPHVLLLHMAYLNFCILIHRPWSSKSSQPDSRVGPGYVHARGVCRHSASEIASLLRRHESHYGFRKMNVYVVNIIFSASLILIFGLIAEEIADSQRDDAEHANVARDLNTCFRALDQLGQSFESAKRTHEHLLAIQKHWSQRKRDAKAGTKRRGHQKPSQFLAVQKRSRVQSN